MSKSTAVKPKNVSKHKYSILMPTYNEKQNLPLIVQMCSKYLDDYNINWEIVIIDDNSPDGTLAVAKSLLSIFGDERIVCGITYIIVDIIN